MDLIIFCSRFLRSKDSLQAKENSKVANGGGDYAFVGDCRPVSKSERLICFRPLIHGGSGC